MTYGAGMPTRSIADTYFAIPELMRVARGSYKRAVDERLAAGGFDDLPTASGYLLGISAVVLLLIFPRRGSGTGTTKAAIVFAAVAVLGAPAVASASVVDNRLGPFDTPFEEVPAWKLARSLGAVAEQTETLLPLLEQARRLRATPDLMATQTSAVAAPFIYDTGQEVLPIGGYTGTIPQPTLTALQSMIAHRDFHLVIQAPAVNDPRLEWIANHCLPLSSGARSSTSPGRLRFAFYYCDPNSLR